MIVDQVYVRFFRSFNYDYIRKNNPKVAPKPWESVGSAWQPFVEVSLDPTVTTVVGANESGKSHLLAAIERAVTGEDIKRTDFCRHSAYFRVRENELRYPDFGLRLTSLSEAERQVLTDLTSLSVDTPAVYVFRLNGDRPRVWLQEEGEGIPLNAAAAAQFGDLLPSVTAIDAKVALPSSVPIHALSGDSSFLQTRRKRRKAIDTLDANRDWFDTDASVAAASGPLRAALASEESAPDEAKRLEAELDLATKLLFRVAGVDREAMRELSRALADEQDGHARGIVDQINFELAERLNFPAKWAQDRDFRLTVSPNEYDLVFTISDRTGTHYTFKERSSGLRYFLSYYVQLLADEPPDGDRGQVLLMDEPDAFLSSQGQQDLLRAFEDFVEVPGTTRQVVSVTHSPFLVDRNHGERVRALEKGARDEGTRVVRDAARNHYEPLRSAFGTYVGEAAFIGNANLFVEGLADQVLLVALSAYLRARGAALSESLDLNRVTIVPASGATNLPYLVYLARGRDIDKPAVVVLHDDDAEGRKAAMEIRRGPRQKPIIDERFVLSVAQAAGDGDSLAIAAGVEVVEPEDLLPLSIAAAAAKGYYAALIGNEADVTLTAEDVRRAIPANKRVFRSTAFALSASRDSEIAMDKVGFAREVAHVLEALRRGQVVPGVTDEDSAALESNFRRFFLNLSDALRAAMAERAQETIGQRIERAKRQFLRDHPTGARREEGRALITSISNALDDSPEADIVMRGLNGLRRQHELDTDLAATIEPFSDFVSGLEKVRYASVLAVQQPLGSTIEASGPFISNDDAVVQQRAPAKRRTRRAKGAT